MKRKKKDEVEAAPAGTAAATAEGDVPESPAGHTTHVAKAAGKVGVFLTNPTSRVLSFSTAGEIVFLQPGVNEVQSPHRRLDPEKIGQDGVAQLHGFGVTLRIEKAAPKAAAAFPKDSARHAGTLFGAVMGYPAERAAELAGVENPPAHERIQPVQPTTAARPASPVNPAIPTPEERLTEKAAPRAKGAARRGASRRQKESK